MMASTTYGLRIRIRGTEQANLVEKQGCLERFKEVVDRQIRFDETFETTRIYSNSRPIDL